MPPGPVRRCPCEDADGDARDGGVPEPAAHGEGGGGKVVTGATSTGPVDGDGGEVSVGAGTPAESVPVGATVDVGVLLPLTASTTIIVARTATTMIATVTRPRVAYRSNASAASVLRITTRGAGPRSFVHASRAAIRSAVLAKRSSGSLAIRRRRIAPIRGSMLAGTAGESSGSSAVTCCWSTVTAPPSKGQRPVSISKRMTPTE